MLGKITSIFLYLFSSKVFRVACNVKNITNTPEECTVP